LLIIFLTGSSNHIILNILYFKVILILSKSVKTIYSITHYTIGGLLEIMKRQITLSNRERFDILEIRNRHRLSYFSYTYRVSDKSGENRPIIRWDNFGGVIHYDTYDLNQRLLTQKNCEYKDPKEILKLIRIFKNNLVTMDLDQL